MHSSTSTVSASAAASSPLARGSGGALRGCGATLEGGPILKRSDAAATSYSVSIVLPCLNEAESVGDVVREAQQALDAAGIRGEILVVDNGSTDGSAERAGDAGARVIHEDRRGYGSAYLAGFGAALGDVIVMADADRTYELSAIPAFLERIAAGDELVMGSRFKGRMEPGAMPLLHRWGSPVLSGLLNVLYGTGVSDAHCGMRAFRRAVLPQLRLRMPGMEFASEMIVNAARARLRIGEVPVNYRVRAGRSKLHTLRDGWRHLRFLFLYSPTHLFVWPGAALFVVGTTLLLALAPGPLIFAGFFLDIHFMVLGLLLTLVGFQIVATGLHAKTLAVALKLQPLDPTLRGLRRVFTLERGLILGSLLFIAGVVVDVTIAVEWIASGLGPLDEVRRALLATAAILLGIQVVFASLFLSVIDLQMRDQ